MNLSVVGSALELEYLGGFEVLIFFCTTRLCLSEVFLFFSGEAEGRSILVSFFLSRSLVFVILSPLVRFYFVVCNANDILGKTARGCNYYIFCLSMDVYLMMKWILLMHALFFLQRRSKFYATFFFLEHFYKSHV